MGRPRTAKHPKAEPAAPPEDRPQGHAGPDAGGEAVSKSAAAREAIAQGIESPEDAVAFIKQRFGIEMSKPHFSAVKSQLKKREASGGSAAPKARRGRKPKAAVEGYLAPPKVVPTGEGDLLEALEAMKPLVASLGAEKVKRIVDLLA
jgi:hypothetical protein